MKRFSLIIAILLFVTSSASLFAHEPYDSEATKEIMQANLGAFRQLRTAQSNGNFLAAAGELAILAEGSFRLLRYAAPQGSQEDWERIHSELVMAALRGIVACGQEDAEGLAEAVGIIGDFNREGHGEFR